MKTKRPKLTEYHVDRCWTVDYKSTCVVHAASVEEAARLALADDDFDDAESCDGSEGPTEIWRIVEVTPDGLEIEQVVPEPRPTVISVEEAVSRIRRAIASAAECGACDLDMIAAVYSVLCADQDEPIAVMTGDKSVSRTYTEGRTIEAE